MSAKDTKIEYQEIKEVTKITVNGTTSIPKSIREALHLAVNDHILWILTPDGTVTLKRLEI